MASNPRLPTDASRQASPRASRAAFTLLEMLLTLCVMAVAAALVWPALETPLANGRLRKGAEEVRAAWIRARLEAVEAGEVRRFYFEPEGRKFRIRASAQAAATSAADSKLPGTMAAPGLATPLGGTSTPSADESLPEGISFAAAQPEDDLAALAGIAASEPGEEEGWSRPVFFYPDGSCSDVRIVLKNPQGYGIEIALRGLTAVATVGRVVRQEELAR